MAVSNALWFLLILTVYFLCSIALLFCFMQLHPCDFGVRFCVQPDNGEVTFNLKKCKSCDPCYIGELYMRSVSRKLSI